MTTIYSTQNVIIFHAYCCDTGLYAYYIEGGSISFILRFHGMGTDSMEGVSGLTATICLQLVLNNVIPDVQSSHP